MSIYRLDLDALEESEKEHELSAAKVNEKIEELHSVINEVNEDIYSGEDGDNFRLELAGFTEKEVKPLQEKLAQIKTVLADGLNDAQRCKKLCNDFPITLGGESNGKSEADMHGELYCDQSAIEGLKGYCRSALSYSDSIRTLCTSINDTLWGLVMVKLYPAPYTSAIKEGCDKVDRLEDHSRELGSYAEAAELIDSSFQRALDGCVPAFFLGMEMGVGVGEQNARTEIIMRIMGQQDTLSEKDKAILDEQLKAMEEKGDIEELQKVAEHAGNGENGAWTAGDAYVMAHIYKYAENNTNTELATVVYDKMKKVKYIKSRAVTYWDLVEVVYEYEVMLDEDKVSAILGELNPDDDGLAYYSLQRRSKYTQTIERPNKVSNEEVAKLDFRIKFECENGKLVSAFTAGGETMRLASVDMNEVVGQKWEESPMKGMGFSKEERTMLMSSIYTDEDISFVGDLVRANTQGDYRDLFLRHEPDSLGDVTMSALYQYSYSLMNSDITYDGEGHIETKGMPNFKLFINGLLESDIELVVGTQEYLANLAVQSDLQMNSIMGVMSENLDREDTLKILAANYDMNAKLYGLYTGLLYRRESNIKSKYFQNMGNCLQAYGLDLVNNGKEKVEGELVSLEESHFFYKENMMYYEDGKLNSIYDERRIAFAIGTGSDSLRLKKVDELIEAQKEKRMAVPKAVVKMSIGAASVFQPWVGLVAGAVEGGATLDSSKIRGTAKDIFGSLNNQYLNGSKVGKTGIVITDGLIDTVISYREADEKVSRIERDLSTALFGEVITVNGISIVKEGVYTSNSALKKVELEKNGLSFMAEPSMREAVSAELKAQESGIAYDDYDELENLDEVIKRKDLIPTLYLIWTGEVYVDENGVKSKIDDINELSAGAIVTGMGLLNSISFQMHEKEKSLPYTNIATDMYTSYDYFDKFRE